MRKQVTELEIELRGRCHKRDWEGSYDDPDYTKGNIGESSHYSGSRQLRDKSHETMGLHHDSPHRDRCGHHNVAFDAMSRALRRAARSPFSNEIEHTEMPRHFSRPSFTSYDGKTNSMEHVSHYIQMMSL